MSLITQKKTRILLINPPNDLGVGEGCFNDVIDIYQPLGLGYLCAVLEEAGYPVGVIDAKVEKLSGDEVIRRMLVFRPDIIGLSAATPDLYSAALIAKQIKAAGNYTVFIGGAHVSALPEETMQESCFDYGVVGEGERTVAELVEVLSEGRLQDIPQIKGIVFRDGLKIVRTPPREYIKDLDTLPFPARHLFPPLSKYTYLYYKSLPLATIITSRGCPYQCTFCDRAVFGNQVRMRSIGNILDEIQMLVKDYFIREVNIVDDLFTISPARVEEFCRGLLLRKLKISWACMGRADRVTPEILKTMKKAGCWRINFGIESGNQRVLDSIKKDISLAQIQKAVKWTSALNIRVLGFFILGLPQENKASISDTLKFAKSLPLDRVVFFIAQPLPGTQIYKTALAQGKINKDIEYRYYHLYCFPEKLSFITEGLTADELKHFRKKAYRDFYLRPQYIFKQLCAYREVSALPKRIKALLKAIW